MCAGEIRILCTVYAANPSVLTASELSPFAKGRLFDDVN